jgi:hypothetical protein
VSQVCRIGWYERGRVTRFVPGRPKAEIPADEPSAPANLKAGPLGVKIVEAEIDGRPWFGRLAPRRAGQNEGIVLLYKSPQGDRV